MSAHRAAPTQPLTGNEWRVVPLLLPYLLEYRGRVAAALVFLAAAKLANVAVPLVMKEVVDGLDTERAMLAVPAALLAIYGLLRFSTVLFAELRDVVFVRVTQRAIRRVALSVFRHLHALSLRFHLERQTGGMSRDIERGTKGISTLLSYLLFSILPVILEFALVAAVLLGKFDWRFAAITFGAVAVYIGFTVVVTEWRMHFRRRANELDSRANTRAVDSLLNYETVKYFGNEEFEARRYDDNLRHYEAASVKNEASLGLLNIGQSLIIAAALTALMFLAADGVVGGALTLGDLVLVNGLLIQLYIPLNFLGMVYREIKQALIDMDRMFGLLSEHREVEDKPDAVVVPAGPATVEFRDVDFAYEPARRILHDVSFTIGAGERVAVVGPSGSGKSTLARLLYRFYDVGGGAVRVNGVDLRDLRQASLRAAIGIVPQDTVLFNDTIRYNIRYGRPEASDAEVVEAARAAHIHDFIESLPAGYEATVGERGLKLSGGEKQRVAIARALLKNPRILIFDEATSALDSRSEKAIQAELERAAEGRTTLVIAHRLSTVMDAHQILVLVQGRIVERGTHAELLEAAGEYARMWALQQQAAAAEAVLERAKVA
ncbi:MAG: ABC transporter ATP-binding protein/permease [Betaproteobacteria bacterium]|jgi:ABC-type transport system involved in Fe-S cluster assembly fused permease/ATPase subunit|nr:ABC transporter ATP-binding protein/permease [Betaproteobacteria bacterium]